MLAELLRGLTVRVSASVLGLEQARTEEEELAAAGEGLVAGRGRRTDEGRERLRVRGGGG